MLNLLERCFIDQFTLPSSPCYEVCLRATNVSCMGSNLGKCYRGHYTTDSSTAQVIISKSRQMSMTIGTDKAQLMHLLNWSLPLASAVANSTGPARLDPLFALSQAFFPFDPDSKTELRVFQTRIKLLFSLDAQNSERGRRGMSFRWKYSFPQTDQLSMFSGFENVNHLSHHFAFLIEA